MPWLAGDIRWREEIAYALTAVPPAVLSFVPVRPHSQWYSPQAHGDFTDRSTRRAVVEFAEHVLRELVCRVPPGQQTSLESTTYPRITDGAIRPILDASGLKTGVDFFVAHSPERVDLGKQRYTTKNPYKAVGVSDPASPEVAPALRYPTIQHVMRRGIAFSMSDYHEW